MFRNLQFGKGINRRRLEIVDLGMRDIEILNQHPRKVLDRLNEIEEDHRQWKDGPWDMGKLTSTNLVQILYHVICVLLAYNLSGIYSNTRKGQEFARKTLRQLTREQARRHDIAVLVFVENYYAVFEIRYFTGILIRLSPNALIHLRGHFPIPEIGFT